MEDDASIFRRLKPSCVAASQAVLGSLGGHTDVQDVPVALEGLMKTFQGITAQGSGFSAKLTEYAFFPLSQVFQQCSRFTHRALELALRCLDVLLNYGWQPEVPPADALQLVILLSFMAGGSPSSGQSTKPSDETQQLAFACLSSLLARVSKSDRSRSSLAATDNVPALGHAVSVMLDGLLVGKSGDTQLSAISALHSFYLCLGDPQPRASFFPGTVSALAKVLTPSTQVRRPYRVLESSLGLLSDVIEAILSDEAVTGYGEFLKASNVGNEGKSRLLDRSWLEATSAQVRLALANVMRLRHHDRDEVRGALRRLCLMILEQCGSTLSNCSAMTIETLVTLAHDEQDDNTQSILRQIATANPRIAELLRSSLYDWVSSLPRLMQSSDDTAKRRAISQISQSFSLLNHLGLDLSIVNAVLATNLRDSVAIAAYGSVKRDPISSIERKSSSPMSLIRLNGKASQITSRSAVMSSTNQEETVKELRSLLHRIAEHSNSLSVAEELLRDLPTTEGDAQLASLWISLSILQSAEQQSRAFDDLISFGETSKRKFELLEELYTFALATLTKTSAEDEDPDWRLQALCLDAIALQSSVLKEDFRIELVDVLYAVVHAAGAPTESLRNHAVACLDRVASACGYRSTSELVISNVDYLVNAIGLKLNTFDVSPQAPMVLLMMIKLVGPSLLPYLDDLVDNIFAALECFHGYPKLVELLFAVLKGIVEEGAKTPQLQITAGDEKKHLKPPVRPITLSELVLQMKERKAEPQSCAGAQSVDHEDFPRRPWKESRIEEISGDDGGGDEPASERPNEDDEKPLPPTMCLLQKIATLTQHYLPQTQTSTLTPSLLSLLRTSIPAIATHEDTFLPLIHTLWPPLLDRFNDRETNPWVLCDISRVLSQFCLFAGDFMSGRMEHAWPQLKTSWATRVAPVLFPAAATVSTDRRGIKSAAKRKQTRMTIWHRPRYIPPPTLALHDALVDLFITMLDHVRISDELFDEVLDILTPDLLRENASPSGGTGICSAVSSSTGRAAAAGEDRGREVTMALERRNADAVWFLLQSARADGSLDDREEGPR